MQQRNKSGMFTPLIDRKWIVSELERVNRPNDDLIIDVKQKFGVTLGTARNVVYEVYKEWKLGHLTRG